MKNPRALTEAELLAQIATFWRSERRSDRIVGAMGPRMLALLDEAVRRDRTCMCLGGASGVHDIRCPASRP